MKWGSISFALRASFYSLVLSLSLI